MATFADLRKAAGYTQQTLANRLQIDRTTVTKWELGKSFPRVQMLPKLADVLNTSVEELLDGMYPNSCKDA